MPPVLTANTPYGLGLQRLTLIRKQTMSNTPKHAAIEDVKWALNQAQQLAGCKKSKQPLGLGQVQALGPIAQALLIQKNRYEDTKLAE
jgi:hypothetical protein